MIQRDARATFRGNQPAAALRPRATTFRRLRRRGRRALSISAIIRASSKARGEANAISCVRSYSTRSSHHCSGVSFFFTSGSIRPPHGFRKGQDYLGREGSTWRLKTLDVLLDLCLKLAQL